MSNPTFAPYIWSKIAAFSSVFCVQMVSNAAMHPPIIFAVRYREEKKLISIMEGFSYADFSELVTGKWSSLQLNNFYCTCSVGDESGICMDSNEDFNSLLILCEHTHCRVVSVVVTLRVNSEVGSASVSDCLIREDYIRGSFDCDVMGADQYKANNKSGSGSKTSEKSTLTQNLAGGNNVEGNLVAESSPDDQSVNVIDESDEGVIYGANHEKGWCSAGSFVQVSGEKRKKNCENKAGCNGIGLGADLCGRKSQKIKAVSDDLGVHANPDFGGIVGNIPCYDVCPTLKKTPLLSDDWGNIMEGGVGVEFRGGAPEFRRELSKYSTKMGFRFTYFRNDSRYINAVCKEEAQGGCEWYIKAKRMNVTKFFVIYKANLAHSCVGKLVNDTSRMGAKLMGSLVLQNVKSKPEIGGREIIQIMRDSYGIEISYSRAWRTVEAARNMIFGSYDESYDQLKWYCRAIMRKNPGSVVCLQQNRSKHHFDRVFIAFKACIDGFQSCRPMLFIDDTFMKERAKGTLLSATAKDGNNGLFPVAFAIVSAENNENWIWFLQKLRDNIRHDNTIFYISDRNLGLMNAFPKVFNEPVHFYCLVHLLNNLKLRCGTGWTNTTRANLDILFKECAYAPNLRLFNDKLKEFIQVGGESAEKFVSDIDFDKWAVAYSPHITRYGEMTSNAAESFNSWIRDARALPITYMVDNIMKNITKWYVKRRRVARTWNSALCPTKQDLWNYLSEIGRSWMIFECPDGSYQVASSPTTIVDLNIRTCSCYQWQVQGFPCSHAVAVIRKACSTVYSHIEVCFFAKNYMDCYNADIHLIPETERFECIDPADPNIILPPILNRPAGRPKKDKRITSYGLFKKKKANMRIHCHNMRIHCHNMRIHCHRCGKTGTHDTCTCPEPELQTETGCEAG